MTVHLQCKCKLVFSSLHSSVAAAGPAPPPHSCIQTRSCRLHHSAVAGWPIAWHPMATHPHPKASPLSVAALVATHSLCARSPQGSQRSSQPPNLNAHGKHLPTVMGCAETQKAVSLGPGHPRRPPPTPDDLLTSLLQYALWLPCSATGCCAPARC